MKILENNDNNNNNSNNIELKIADFGFMKYIGKNSFDMNTLCGTIGYQAPEIMEGKISLNASFEDL